MMQRRAFLAGSIALLAAPPSAEAHQRSQTPRIGMLALSAESALSPYIKVFRDTLRELGYVERSGIDIEFRSANGKVELLQELAMELARLRVDVIVTQTTPAAQAA